MEEEAKLLTGKRLAAIALVIVIIIAGVAVYWYYYLAPTPAVEGVSVSISPSEVEPDENVIASGSTDPAIVNTNVTLTYTKPDGSTFNRTVTTDSDGEFTDTFSSDVTGKWTVMASIEDKTSTVRTFYIFVTPPIKIGAIGPMSYIQGIGIDEGVRMAAEEVNDAGGVLGRKLVVVTEDETTDLAQGRANMEKLITIDKADFVIGGFRSEIVFPMRDETVKHKKIFIMTGSATNELLNCFGSLTMQTPCGKCVLCDYDNYKYVFRAMPLNTTALFSFTLVPFLRYHFFPNYFDYTAENKVRVACVVENVVAWDLLWAYIENIPNVITGANGTIVYKSRPSPMETDFSAILSDIEDAEAQVIMHVFSAEAGLSFIEQWGTRQTPAIPIGINVLAQEADHWDNTGGYCEYETLLSTPPRIPLTNTTLQFYDTYIERWGHDPIYTAGGSYTAVMILAEAIERAGTIDSDAVVVELEKTDYMTTIGRFKFDRYHDVWAPVPYKKGFQYFEWKNSTELGYPNTWVMPMLIQWIDDERVPVYPFGFSWTQELQLPHWMS